MESTSAGELVAFTSVVFLGVLAIQYLLGFYQANEPRGIARLGRGWVQRWDFSPDTIGGFPLQQLALGSLLGLFLEMLMIRWVSSEIRIFAYFKNFVGSVDILRKR